MKRPLVGLVVVYGAGILTGSQFAWPLRWILVTTLLLLLLFIVCHRKGWSLAPLMAAVFCAGIWMDRLAERHSSPSHITNLIADRAQNISLSGVIVTDPGYRELASADSEASEDRHSFILDLEALNRDGDWKPATGRVLIFVSGNPASTPLHYGDQIECSALLRVPEAPTNPGCFDYRRWLQLQHIAFTATIRKSDACSVLAIGRGNAVMALSLRLRRHFERALNAGLENEPQLAGVLAGMVIGERSEIPQETYTQFQQTGVFHVFAVSGLHVGVVAGVVLIFLRLVRVPRRWAALLAVPLLILYVFATGARPGAVRALVMASVWILSWSLVRPADALSALATAALVLLVWEPLQLFQGAFILSFSVVLALVVLTRPIQTRLEKLVQPDPLLPEELIPRWRKRLHTPLHWLIGLLSCSLASWIGLLPLMAIYFNLFTPISILANLIAIPLVGVIIPLGMLSTAVHFVWPALSVTFNNANFFLLTTMIKTMEVFSRWGHWFVQAPPPWLTIGYYIIGFVLLSRRLPRRAKYWLAGGAAAALLLGIVLSREKAVEVTVLDLRDGTAVFFKTSSAQYYLIDGGGPRTARRILLPFLRSRGVNGLAGLFVTHFDKAHAGGLTGLGAEIPPRHVFYAGGGSRSKYFAGFMDANESNGIESATLRAGEERFLDGNLRLRVLSPLKDAKPACADDAALVVLLEHGPTRVLLTSDTGAHIEQQLLAAGTDVRAHILIKGRHSREPSGTDAFLEAVKPQIVVQTAGSQGSRSFVDTDLRARLQARNTPFYQTDETGAVTIRLHDTGYDIQTCLGGTARLGKEP